MKYNIPDQYKDLYNLNVEQEFVDIFADVINITQPKEILETGVFWGDSSSIFLILSNANLTSFDPIINVNDFDNLRQGIPFPDKSKQEEYLKNIKNIFKDKWTFYKEGSENAYPLIKDKTFDLFFIDGDHWYSGLDADYDLSKKLNIPWIFIDDFNDTVKQKYFRDMDNFFTPIKEYIYKEIPKILVKKK